MKNIKLIPFVLVVLAILLSACSGAATPATSAGGGKPQPSVVAFTGVIESIDGDQWVVNGQSITVDLSVIKDGPFQAGDTVKVEARVEADGSVVALRVETPSAADLANDNSNASNSNDATNVNANEDNSVNGNTNADNSNDANANDTNSNDANSGTGAGGKEVFGTVDAITDTSITVGGQTYQFAPGAEIKGAIVAGDFVKIHLIVNADGTLAVREVGLSDPSQAGNDNGNDDNGNDDNSNDDDDDDDNGNGDNSNDDDDDDDNNGNDDNSNGGNSNGG